MLKVFEQNGKYGVMDDNKIIVPCKYDRCEDFKDGFACVKLNGKWGLIDTSGKEVVPPKYEGMDIIWGIREGYIEVENNGKKGLVKVKTGKEVVPCEYKEVHAIGNGVASFCKVLGTKVEFEVNPKFISNQRENRKYGLIDLKTGQEVVQCKYDSIGWFKNGFSVVELDGKEGVINSDFEVVVPCKFDQVYDFKNGFFMVEQNGLWYFLDQDGKQVNVQGYKYLENINDGYALAKNYRKDYDANWNSYVSKTEWVIIDEFGKEVRKFCEGDGHTEYQVMEYLKKLRGKWLEDEQERLKNVDTDINTI